MSDRMKHWEWTFLQVGIRPAAEVFPRLYRPSNTIPAMSCVSFRTGGMSVSAASRFWSGKLFVATGWPYGLHARMASSISTFVISVSGEWIFEEARDEKSPPLRTPSRISDRFAARYARP
jgi:hypothetical protein